MREACTVSHPMQAPPVSVHPPIVSTRSSSSWEPSIEVGTSSASCRSTTAPDGGGGARGGGGMLAVAVVRLPLWYICKTQQATLLCSGDGGGAAAADLHLLELCLPRASGGHQTPPFPRPSCACPCCCSEAVLVAREGCLAPRTAAAAARAPAASCPGFAQPHSSPSVRRSHRRCPCVAFQHRCRRTLAATRSRIRRNLHPIPSS